VKLLFDSNLSYKLVRNLADLFPDSAHVSTLGISRSDDWTVWMSAGAQGFVLVTKDEDLPQLALVKGHPPKVIWIRLGNCSTGQIESLLRWRIDAIREFVADPELSVLTLT
jgi:predicted nuclease of predicted toxin-antitoxin system